ncbi:hypothetical protein ADUPG1_008928 [Aduncisulcus paluster]|uniref:t-SNARE coiled-coil homology domain-containing protein n=1 Tax=Aduncisulcus paluster TaxID=2918883 RepID=A0ABQ5KTR8_9EUKA|nr:hypothetical protein ADUPG1_008928 [Aduncisulcus paluster]
MDKIDDWQAQVLAVKRREQFIVKQLELMSSVHSSVCRIVGDSYISGKSLSAIEISNIKRDIDELARSIDEMQSLFEDQIQTFRQLRELAMDDSARQSSYGVLMTQNSTLRTEWDHSQEQFRATISRVKILFPRSSISTDILHGESRVVGARSDDMKRSHEHAEGRQLDIARRQVEDIIGIASHTHSALLEDDDEIDRLRDGVGKIHLDISKNKNAVFMIGKLKGKERGGEE